MKLTVTATESKVSNRPFTVTTTMTLVTARDHTILAPNTGGIDPAKKVVRSMRRRSGGGQDKEECGGEDDRKVRRVSGIVRGL